MARLQLGECVDEIANVLKNAATGARLVMGTPGFMSPEQADLRTASPLLNPVTSYE